MSVLETASSSIDDIAFLARSDHRVAVFAELAAREQTRMELREATGIIQPTLGRILTDFEDRDWVRKEDSIYSLTPFGALLADQFAELVGVVDTMREFQGISQRLPLEEFGFDLRRFARARITTPSRTDALAHLRREEELADGAKSLRHLCSSAFPPHITTYRDRIVEGDQRFEAVITGDALDAARSNPEVAASVHDIVTADNATIYRYDGPVAYQLGVADEVATIIPLDEAGSPRAVIETDDDVIRDWVNDELDTYRSKSTLVA